MGIIRNTICIGTCRKKKCKRDFYNNAIKDNKDSKYLWKHIKDISYMNNNKNSGLHGG